MSTDIRHIEASFLETLGFDRLQATSGIAVSTLGVSTDAREPAPMDVISLINRRQGHSTNLVFVNCERLSRELTTVTVRFGEIDHCYRHFASSLPLTIYPALPK